MGQKWAKRKAAISASEHKEKNIIQQLCMECNHSLLVQTVMFNHLPCARMLIQMGVDLNGTDHMGENAIHTACRSRSAGSIQFLLEQGTSVNVRDDKYQTPLFYVARYNDIESICVLLDWGADTNMRDLCGRTVVMYADLDEKISLLRLLLAAGADCNIDDEENVSPLSYALYYGEIDLARTLILGGATGVTDADRERDPELDVACTQMQEYRQTLLYLAKSTVRNALLMCNHSNLLITVPKLTELPQTLREYLIDESEYDLYIED